MNAGKVRRRAQKPVERAVVPNMGKEPDGADEGRKSELRGVDEIALETQRRSIAYSRARGLV
ncbi:hypothetical protein [Olsenella phocaeensis]|uniref:hypothetical protein n=1 Tax=Olsenella phocaeensis TaxID=1852385 RepID=UPI003A90E698